MARTLTPPKGAAHGSLHILRRRRDRVHDRRATGPDALLLHGFAADHRVNWVAPGVVDALVAAGRRVIALDARGHGQSDKPHDPGRVRERRHGARRARRCSTTSASSGSTSIGYSMGALVSTRLVPDEPRARSCVLGGIGGRVRGQRGVLARAARAHRATRSRPTTRVDDHRRVGRARSARSPTRPAPTGSRWPRSNAPPRPNAHAGSTRSRCRRW